MSSTVLRALPTPLSEMESTESCQSTPTDTTPLTELGRGFYKGAEGGLYPGGTNEPPAAHLAAGLARASQVVPRDGDGNPSAAGKIGFLSVGLSNTRSDFEAFAQLVEDHPDVHPALVTVNGAQRRKDAEMMAAGAANYWPTVDRRIARRGLTNEQVQVVWLKSALREPAGEFPAEAHRLREYLTKTIHILAERFPNLQLVYVSSRAYGGYSEIPLSPEPYAYESGFAVKWLIADQISGAAELCCDPPDGNVNSPWLGWGPYLWADGERTRADGLQWRRADMAEDGVHPSPTGRAKAASLLFDAMASDPTARPWFLSARTATSPMAVTTVCDESASLAA